MIHRYGHNVYIHITVILYNNLLFTTEHSYIKYQQDEEDNNGRGRLFLTSQQFLIMVHADYVNGNHAFEVDIITDIYQTSLLCFKTDYISCSGD